MTRGRILTDGERDYLKERRVWPNPRLWGVRGEQSPPNRDIKHRIHHNAGRQLRDIIQDFRLDLHAIDEYYKSERPDEWYEYSTITLQHSKDELKELRAFIDQLIQRAETKPPAEEKSEIQDALQELAAGLPHVQAVASNEFKSMNEAEIQWEGNKIVGPPELLEEEEEFRERKKALMAVLGDPGLYEIFTWVEEHTGDLKPQSKIKDRVKSNSEEGWKQVIGRYLKGKHELVTEPRWRYELTERGVCVSQAIESLLNSGVVSDLVANELDEENGSGLKEYLTKNEGLPDVDERQAAVELLRRYFPAN